MLFDVPFDLHLTSDPECRRVTTLDQCIKLGVSILVISSKARNDSTIKPLWEKR